MGNPFTKVFSEIEKMKSLMEEEAKHDQEQKTWCEGETKANTDNLDVKKGQLSNLETAITTLDTTINDPVTGLKKMISDDEIKLEDNRKAQKDQTDARRLENKDYQGNVEHCVEAAAVLKRAVSALQVYYKAAEQEEKKELGIMQKKAKVRKVAQTPPETWSGDFEGQAQGGKKVIDMLKYILSESEKEETAAHQMEQEAQHTFEDSMAALKQEQTDTQAALTNKNMELADSLLELQQKGEDKAKTEQEKVAIERYLERIKPGCDFIVENFATREANRATEAAALDQAVTLLKESPTYASAKAKEQERAQGECAGVCKVSQDQVDCKACLAKVSVPGYCAGHPSTAGC